MGGLRASAGRYGAVQAFSGLPQQQQQQQARRSPPPIGQLGSLGSGGVAAGTGVAGQPAPALSAMHHTDAAAVRHCSRFFVTFS